MAQRWFYETDPRSVPEGSPPSLALVMGPPMDPGMTSDLLPTTHESAGAVSFSSPGRLSPEAVDDRAPDDGNRDVLVPLIPFSTACRSSALGSMWESC